MYPQQKERWLSGYDNVLFKRLWQQQITETAVIWQFCNGQHCAICTTL
jgi:hypothetical protein